MFRPWASPTFAPPRQSHAIRSRECGVMPNELRAPSKEIEVLEPADEDESSPPRKKSPIVAAVVGAHDGRVSVESRPGRTVFTVRVPLTREE